MLKISMCVYKIYGDTVYINTAMVIFMLLVLNVVFIRNDSKALTYLLLFQLHDI